MKRSLISFGLTLLLAVLLHPVMAQVESERDDPDAGNPIRPLDIVLLVDSSESTRDSDPEGLRTRASKFLLDYVLAAGESIGLNHRFAFANFNTDIIDSRALDLFTQEALRNALVLHNEGYTDFIPALRFARNELLTNGVEVHNQAVILFTDGQPELLDNDGSPIQVDLDAYYQELGQLLKQMQEAGIQVFVVATGDTQDNQRRWTSSGRVPVANYRSIDSTTNLSEVYHNFLANLLGLQTAETKNLQESEIFAVDLPPYLEQVVFSIVKEDVGSVVTLREPSGARVPATSGDPNDLHEIYTKSEPNPGIYTIGIDDGDAQVWVDQAFPLLQINVPMRPVALNSDVEVEAELIRLNKPVADNNLDLELLITLPNGTYEQHRMRSTGSGRYVFSMGSLLEDEGGYHIEARALRYGTEFPVRSNAVTVTAFPVPTVIDFHLDGERVVGRPVTVTVRLENADVLPKETILPITIRNPAQEAVGGLELRDDGVMPDEEAQDGLYTGVSSMPVSAGKYTVVLRLTGETVNGVLFDLRPIWPIEIYPFLVPVPEISATPVRRETPLPPPTVILDIEPTPKPPLPARTRRQNDLFTSLMILVTVTMPLGAYLFFVERKKRRLEGSENKAVIINLNERVAALQEEKVTLAQEKRQLQTQIEEFQRLDTLDDLLGKVDESVKHERWDEAEKTIRRVLEAIHDYQRSAESIIKEKYVEVSKRWLGLIRSAEVNLAAQRDGDPKRNEVLARLRQRRNEFMKQLVEEGDSSAIDGLLRGLGEVYWCNNGSEAVIDLYDTLFDHGRANINMILNVIVDAKISPLHQLCQCLLDVQDGKGVNADKLQAVADAAKLLPQESGMGLARLYELLKTLTMDSVENHAQPEDFDYVKNQLDLSGPKSLIPVLQEAKKMIRG